MNCVALPMISPYFRMSSPLLNIRDGKLVTIWDILDHFYLLLALAHIDKRCFFHFQVAQRGGHVIFGFDHDGIDTHLYPPSGDWNIPVRHNLSHGVFKYGPGGQDGKIRAALRSGGCLPSLPLKEGKLSALSVLVFFLVAPASLHLLSIQSIITLTT